MTLHTPHHKHQQREMKEILLTSLTIATASVRFLLSWSYLAVVNLVFYRMLQAASILLHLAYTAEFVKKQYKTIFKLYIMLKKTPLI